MTTKKTTKITNQSEGYRIGAVSCLTGVSADNLRVWERRNQAFTPARNDSGDRSYSPDDISRLKLMKTLVDGGDTISAIASLDDWLMVDDCWRMKTRRKDFQEVGADWTTPDLTNTFTIEAY